MFMPEKKPEYCIDTALAIRDLKNKGKSDRFICKELHMHHNTLQGYKQILVTKDLESLTQEGQDVKRCELDEQVQSIVGKLAEVVEKIENDHEEHKKEITNTLNDSEVPETIKIKLRRYLRYPVEDMIEVQKALLNAVELRSRIWGLDKEIKDNNPSQGSKKIVFNINGISNVEAASTRLNNIADAIVGKKNGMPRLPTFKESE
jgi:hypothetical protein